MNKNDFHWKLCRLVAYIVRYPLWSLLHLIGIITMIYIIFRLL